MCNSVQGANVVCGTNLKRPHSDNVEGGSGYQKQARIETDAQDMDLDDSGMLGFIHTCKVR